MAFETTKKRLDKVYTDSTLTGNGTPSSPLHVASSGGIGGSISSGQIAIGDTTANTIKGTSNATLDSSGNSTFASVNSSGTTTTAYIDNPSTYSFTASHHPITPSSILGSESLYGYGIFDDGAGTIYDYNYDPIATVNYTTGVVTDTTFSAQQITQFIYRAPALPFSINSSGSPSFQGTLNSYGYGLNTEYPLISHPNINIVSSHDGTVVQTMSAFSDDVYNQGTFSASNYYSANQTSGNPVFNLDQYFDNSHSGQRVMYRFVQALSGPEIVQTFFNGDSGYETLFGASYLGARYGISVGNNGSKSSYPLDVYDALGTGYDMINSISGNWSMTSAGVFTAQSFVIAGGSSSQFLKANGSVDSSTYLPYEAKGTATLVSGTKAITISGLTTGNQAFVTIAVTGGTLGAQYKAVCTTNTLTITAVSVAGATVVTDTSTLNYLIL